MGACQVIYANLCSFSQTEGATTGETTDSQVLAVRVQNTALDVLQVLVSQRYMSAVSIQALSMALLVKLQTAIRYSRLTLQGKTLRLLGSVLILPGMSFSREHRRSASLTGKTSTSGLLDNGDQGNDIDRSLLAVTIDGLSTPTNRPVLHNWVTFALAIAPVLQRRKGHLTSLCQHVSRQLQGMLQLDDPHKSSKSVAVPPGIPVEGLILLLQVLELATTLLSTPRSSIRSVEGTPRLSEGGSGIFGIMSGVFSAEVPINPDGVGLFTKHLSDVLAQTGLGVSERRSVYASEHVCDDDGIKSQATVNHRRRQLLSHPIARTSGTSQAVRCFTLPSHHQLHLYMVCEARRHLGRSSGTSAREC